MTGASRLSLAFVLGAFATTSAIVLLGGHSLSMLIVGFFLCLLLIIIPTCLWPRRISRLLWAYAHAWEDGRCRWQKTLPIAERELGRRSTDPKPNPIAGDVVSALVNLGTNRKRAEKVVEQVIRHQEYGSFEEMFSAALEVVRSVNA